MGGYATQILPVLRDYRICWNPRAEALISPTKILKHLPFPVMICEASLMCCTHCPLWMMYLWQCTSKYDLNADMNTTHKSLWHHYDVVMSTYMTTKCDYFQGHSLYEMIVHMDGFHVESRMSCYIKCLENKFLKCIFSNLITMYIT